MYELIQIGSKLVIIAAIFLVAGFAALRVWRADIDLRQLLSPSRAVDRSARGAVDWIPTRDHAKLYQNSQPVADVHGPVVNEKHRIVRFAKVDKSLKLDIAKEFEFQKWRLRYKDSAAIGKVGGLAMEPDRAFMNMTCEILGVRGPF